MKTLMFVLLLLLTLGCARVQTTAEKMPDLSQLVQTSGRMPGPFCADTGIAMYSVGYDEQGMEDGPMYRAIAYYVGDGHGNPIIVAVMDYQKPEEPPMVYVSLTRNSTVSFKGRAGENPVGNDVCDLTRKLLKDKT